MRFPPRKTALPLGLSCLFVVALGASASASDPLSQKIDQLIEASHSGPLAKTIGDAEFYRRVSLDLTGTIPSSTDLRKFLSDKSPKKREVLIDQLLASPEYVRHMTNVFDIMLMERRPQKYIKNPEWEAFLYNSFAQNKPWNRFAAELFRSDGTDPKLRPAARFLLDRGVEPNMLTRDIGRIFFGRDMQCAQCHDHPIIDHYKQSDYYGIYSFVSRSYVFTKSEKKKKTAMLAERAEGSVKFKSVFTKESGSTSPKLPDEVSLVDPMMEPTKEWKVKPAKNVLPVPGYSRRNRLADEIANGHNIAFRKNIVNRLWAQMMGRGIVDPVDLHHPDNPPTYPELLNLLAADFAANKFDIKKLLRTLALTKTYQRSIELPVNKNRPVGELKKRIAAWQNALKQKFAANEKTEKDVTSLEDRWKPLQNAVKDTEVMLTKTKSGFKGFDKKIAPLDAMISKTLATQTPKQTAKTALDQSLAKLSQALKSLPADKDLQKTQQLMTAKIKKLNVEIAKLESTISTSRKKLAPLTKQRNAAQASYNKSQRELIAHLKKLAPAESAYTQKRIAWKNDVTIANALEKRIELLESFVTSVEKDQLTSTNKKNFTVRHNELQAIEKKYAPKIQALARSQQSFSTAKTTHDGLIKQIPIEEQRLASLKRMMEILSSAKTQATTAQKQLPEDKELAQIVSNMNTQVGSRQKQFVTLGQQIATDKKTLQVSASTLIESQKQVAVLKTQLKEPQQQIATLGKQVSELQKTVTSSQLAAEKALEELTKHWTRYFIVGNLKQQSPEQLAMSMMQATGQLKNYYNAAKAEWKKKNPKKGEPPAAELEKLVHTKIQGQIRPFVQLFGASAGQPQNVFFATADQALFLSNNGQIQSWLRPSGNNLTSRLSKLKDPKSFAEELYLSVLTRLPTQEEIADVKNYLASRPKDRATAVSEIVWGLLTSNEFRFNH